MLLCCSLFIDGYAQQAQGTANTLDAAMAESMKKDKEKSDKDITDGKASTKASTWMNRAKTYQSIAIQNIKLDSNAAMVAYEAYNKVVELDKDKKGGPGKLAKEATETLKSRDMYNAIMQQGVAKFQSKNYPEAVKLMAMAGDILPQDTLAPLYTAIGAQQIKPMAVKMLQSMGRWPCCTVMIKRSTKRWPPLIRELPWPRRTKIYRTSGLTSC